MKRITGLLLVIILLAVPFSVAFAENPELIRNGSFEGTELLPDYWYSEAWEGEFVARGKAEDDGGTSAYLQSSIENDVRLCQEISVEPDTHYIITCKIKTKDVANGAGACIAVVDSYAYSTSIFGTNDWQDVVLVGKTGGNQKSMVVAARLGGYGATSAGEAWFRNFSVKKLDNAGGYTVADFSNFNDQPNNHEGGGTGITGIFSSPILYIGIVLCIAIVAGAAIYSKSRDRKAGEKDLDTEKGDASAKEGGKKGKSNTKTSRVELGLPHDTKLNLTKRDRLLCLGLTLIYAVIALLNLGSLQAPETAWQATFGDKVTITLEEETQISAVWLFGGLYTGNMMITDEQGRSISYNQVNGDMFRWKKLDNAGTLKSKTFTIEVTSGKIWINELAFFDAQGNLLHATASEGAQALLDEQSTIPKSPSYFNGMYFDELYHARTAYEHLKGLEPYENSHPPLGKVFIMIGVAIFGMNPFGWRVMGTLFGIGMVPIMFCFGKRLFKRTEFAFIAAALFAFDFMHFTQTRIATIDVYGVFFIILMYYYMYQYYCMNFFTDGLKKTLKPLALAGLFFGLGAASKWICIYAGAGLAILLVISLCRRFMESKKLFASHSPADRELGKQFRNNALFTLLWCVIFFAAIPVVIYVLSYLPYMLSVKHYGLKDVWHFQEFMYNYHANLTATHTYASAWWEWPFTLRPVWYYVGYDVGAGNVSTISGFGSPAVWWISTIGTIALIIGAIIKKIKMEKGMTVLFVALAANYLPWVLITRCTFQYHFFATVPFIVLSTVYFVKFLEEKYAHIRWVKWIKWIWLALALILFIMFYPVISGYPTPMSWVDHVLKWLPRWAFRGM